MIEGRDGIWLAYARRLTLRQASHINDIEDFSFFSGVVVAGVKAQEALVGKRERYLRGRIHYVEIQRLSSEGEGLLGSHTRAQALGSCNTHARTQVLF